MFSRKILKNPFNFVFNHFMRFDNSSNDRVKDLDTISQSSRLFHLNKKE